MGYKVPSYKVKNKEWLKSQVSRAFFQDTFLIMKSIFGLTAMLGFKIGHQWIYSLKLVRMES